MNATSAIDELTGTVLEIQRMSTEDGPGLRTTVFFKGCSLRCAWCHNPESIERKPQLQWIESRCIGCGICLDACPRGALFSGENGIVIDRDLCEGCGTCAGACPSTALELMGRTWTVIELADEAARDAPYFGATGGVTASGGEAALQAPFVAAFFGELKRRGIHTALDTSGQCRPEQLDAILPHADLLLYDIKEIDSARHAEFTGSGNELILANLIHAAEFARDRIMPREIWIRTPVIPGATDRRENILGIGAFIAANLAGSVTRWELCAFNDLCRDKYLRLGCDWPYGGRGLMERETMEELAGAACESGVDPAIVGWTGPVRLSEERTGEERGNPAAAKRTGPC
ncbi:MAG: glycyl-radical enzyme activating protein [Spirochaetes bacterium]|nr:glycyl-radical enzyme activating protein [Spirochaetota bacterium]